MNKLLEYKLGCADLELTSCSQAAPGGGLLLALVACKIICCTFAEGETITGLRSSASIGCASLSIILPQVPRRVLIRDRVSDHI